MGHLSGLEVRGDGRAKEHLHDDDDGKLKDSKELCIVILKVREALIC